MSVSSLVYFILLVWYAWGFLLTGSNLFSLFSFFYVSIYITQIILNTCYESNSPNSPSAYRIVSQGYSQPLPLDFSIILLTYTIFTFSYAWGKQTRRHALHAWTLLGALASFHGVWTVSPWWPQIRRGEKRHLALNGIPFSDKCSILALYLTAAKKSHSLFSELVS